MNKKGFTLIELLAVIVILAIIALIATPIILSMIENAKKSAAKSSTYGYIEAINNGNGFADANIDGYEKIQDGTHDVTGLTVKMKGEAPSSGSVTIASGKVTNATICINGYNVTYNGHEAEVGSKCSSSANTSNTNTSTSTIDTCPDCKFVFATDSLEIGTDTVPEDATEDYTAINKNSFIGLIGNETTGVIERAFACGIENGTPFCLEGYDTTVYADPNITTLNTVFPSCEASSSNYVAECSGSTAKAEVYEYGSVIVYEVDKDISCYVDDYGDINCNDYES